MFSIAGRTKTADDDATTGASAPIANLTGDRAFRGAYTVRYAVLDPDIISDEHAVGHVLLLADGLVDIQPDENPIILSDGNSDERAVRECFRDLLADSHADELILFL